MKRVLLLGLLLSLAGNALSIAQDSRLQYQVPQYSTEYFISNKGQWPSQVLYLARTAGMNVWITDHGVIFDKFRSERTGTQRESSKYYKEFDATVSHRVGHTVRLEPVGNLLQQEATPLQQVETQFNYFLGNNPSAWATGVKVYRAVSLQKFSEGIDILLQFDGGKPRYDFIVRPNTDINTLKFRFAGATKVEYIEQGAALRLGTTMGEIVTGRIIAYQEIEGERHNIPCIFTPRKLQDGSLAVGFKIGDYDHTRPLTIDPLVYSTYIGKDGVDSVATFTQDKSGNIVVAGCTDSQVFPTSTGAYDTTYNGGMDAFITKYDDKLSRIIFSTYLGGGSDDKINALTLDVNDNIYVAGETLSPSFPLANAWRYEHGGKIDAFVTKISADGSQLNYSTFLGGAQNDRVLAITVDGTGKVVIGGETNSSNFPVIGGGYQSTLQGKYDGFITRLRSTGIGADFSTYFGGTGDDRISALRYNAAGSFIYFGGDCSTLLSKGVNNTTGTFPDPIWPGDPNRPYDATFNGGTDAFVGNISAAGVISDVNNQFVTYLGSNQNDRVVGLEIASDNSVIIMGETQGGTSVKFPTTVPAYSAKGFTDVFFTKFSSNGRTLMSSLIIGGTGEDIPTAVMRVPASGEYFVIGSTNSSNFPIVSSNKLPLQSTNAGKNDIFLFQVNNSVTELNYSTYLGGTADDYGRGVIALPNGDCYIAATTSTGSLPVFAESLNKTLSGAVDGYIGKVVFGTLAMVAPSAGALFCPGGTASVAWQLDKIDAVGSVSLYYSLNGGNTWVLIDSNAKTSPYSWQIPANLPPGKEYRLRVVHNSGLRDATGNFSLGSPAAIASQPKGATLCPGETFRLEVVGASGVDKYTYQWYKGSQQIPVARDSVFEIQSITPQDAGEYSVTVSSNCQTVKSGTAMLVVKPQTRIVQPPLGGQVEAGKNFTFTVQSSGLNRTYQWFKDTYKLNGAIDSFYTVQSANDGDKGLYRVFVSGDCGMDSSVAAELKVIITGVSEYQGGDSGLSISVSGQTISTVFTPETAADCTIELTDNLGKTIAKRTLTAIQPGAEHNVEFNLPSLSSGVYWVTVTQSGIRKAHLFSIIH